LVRGVQARGGLVHAPDLLGPLEHHLRRGPDPPVTEQVGHALEVAGVDAPGVGVDEVLDLTGAVGHP
jgi:hypothetical protein